MFEHPQLVALTAILETGSFDAAAQKLGITQSAISQRIRALEIAVGSPVVHRTQPVTSTRSGARIAAHADMLQRIDAELETDLGRANDLTLRLAVNADSLDTWFLPALAGLDHRRVMIQIEDQDHSAELLRTGEVAAAVTTRAKPVHGADVLPLGALRYLATASPDFVATHFAEGITPEALETAPSLAFNAKDTLQADWAERASGTRLSLNANFVPSTHGFVTAAKLGVGWGLNPEPLVRDAIVNGTLVVLRPDLPHDTPLYWQSSRIGKGALQSLTANVRRAARRALIPLEAASP